MPLKFAGFSITDKPLLIPVYGLREPFVVSWQCSDPLTPKKAATFSFMFHSISATKPLQYPKLYNK